MSLALILPSCTHPVRRFQPEVDPNTLSDTVFVHYLATVPVATVDEGCRTVLFLTDRDPLPDSFEGRRAALIEMGALRPTWRLAGGEQLDQGTLAYMLRTVCRLPRGLSETVFSPIGIGPRRFALRACIYAGLLPHGTAHEPVSGGALLAAYTRAEEYLAQQTREHAP